MAKFKETEIGKIPEDFERREDLTKAIREFLLKESFLLINNLNERTISHKLAEYLKKYFQDYNVDCEYNRMSKDDKNMNEGYITKKLHLDIEEIKTNSDKGQTVFPDIIIHRSGMNSKNFIVIEIKKKNNNSTKKFDFKKLRAFTTELKYRYGIYLEFNKEDLSDIKFFQKGEEVVNGTRN